MSDARVKKLLEDLRALDANRFALVLAVRDKVLGLDPSVTEEVKYGGLLFSANKAFCGVFAYTKHVSLEFGDGVRCPTRTACWRATASCGDTSNWLFWKTSKPGTCLTI